MVYRCLQASALNTSRKTSSSCPRFNLASDCARLVPTSWFLPHAGLHLATEEQELERGTRYRPVSPPNHLCPHSGDSWRHFFSSDNGVNNINYCVVVLKCLALSTTLLLVNWSELIWDDIAQTSRREAIDDGVNQFQMQRREYWLKGEDARRNWWL